MKALDLLEGLVEDTLPTLAPGEQRAIRALMHKRATYRQWGREPEAQTMGKAVVIAMHAMVRPAEPEPDTNL